MVAILLAVCAVMAAAFSMLLRKPHLLYVTAVAFLITSVIDVAALYGIVSSELIVYTGYLSWTRMANGILIGSAAAIWGWLQGQGGHS